MKFCSGAPKVFTEPLATGGPCQFREHLLVRLPRNVKNFVFLIESFYLAIEIKAVQKLAGVRSFHTL